MDRNLHKLAKSEEQDNLYMITQKKGFSSLAKLKKEYIEESFKFAYNMSFTKEGHHRRNRTNGAEKRRNAQIFCDALNGKLGEYAVYQYFNQQGISWPKPDLSIKGIGEWDSYDYSLEIGNETKHIAVKTTKKAGHLLLLEKDDWGTGGEYLPNTVKTVYDYFMLIRIDSNIIKDLKSKRLYYEDFIEEDFLRSYVENSNYDFDIAGVVTNDFLKEAIKEKLIIKRGDFLQSLNTKMDATNYYIQAGDMYSIESFTTYLNNQ